jgi:hypothetical protein
MNRSPISFCFTADVTTRLLFAKTSNDREGASSTAEKHAHAFLFFVRL